MLAPALAALRIAPYDAITLGGAIAVTAPCWMAFFSAEWAVPAFLATLSLGESLVGPRWLELAVAASPEGREGIYASLAAVPHLALDPGLGQLVGMALEANCPGTGPCQGRNLWLTVMAAAAPGPLLMLLMRPWLRKLQQPPPDAGCATLPQLASSVTTLGRADGDESAGQPRGDDCPVHVGAAGKYGSRRQRPTEGMEGARDLEAPLLDCD